MNCMNHFYETVMELFDILELDSLKRQNKYSPHKKKVGWLFINFFYKFFFDFGGKNLIQVWNDPRENNDNRIFFLR